MVFRAAVRNARTPRSPAMCVLPRRQTCANLKVISCFQTTRMRSSNLPKSPVRYVWPTKTIPKDNKLKRKKKKVTKRNNHKERGSVRRHLFNSASACSPMRSVSNDYKDADIVGEAMDLHLWEPPTKTLDPDKKEAKKTEQEKKEKAEADTVDKNGQKSNVSKGQSTRDKEKEEKKRALEKKAREKLEEKPHKHKWKGVLYSVFFAPFFTQSDTNENTSDEGHDNQDRRENTATEVDNSSGGHKLDDFFLNDKTREY